MANSSVDGLVSGLDTTSIINQLMLLERQPQTRLKTLKTTVASEIAVYQALNSKFSTLASKAQDLARAAGWKAMKASSSSTAVTASASSTASSGQLSFTVAQLARAGAVASTGTVASTAAIVADGPVVLSRGADVLGFAALGAGAGLTTAVHAITVTQATAGATHTATAALAGTTTFGAGATLDVTVDGVAETYTIAAGSYTPAELATALTAASGGDLSASIGSDGALTVTTTHEGSTATLAVTGGTAAASLFLATGGPATTGTDGLLTVDGGSVVTVNDAGPGVTTALSGPQGTIAATFAGGLRVGTAAVANVDPGAGSLGALVESINAVGGGFSAAAVKVGTSGYRLQIASTSTGAASNISVDTTNLTGGAGAFATVQAGRDALIRIGEGAGAYDVTSPTDSIKDLLPGVSIQLGQADPATTGDDHRGPGRHRPGRQGGGPRRCRQRRTVVDHLQLDLRPRDEEGRPPAGRRQRPTAGRKGPLGHLVGGRRQQPRQRRRRRDLAGQGWHVAFDRDKFLAAYAANPAAVAGLFQEGGTATDSGVSYLAASDNTRAGTYAVAITQAAAQAAAAGTTLSGAGLVAAETIEVRVGGATGTSATYAASAGESLDSVADGLNAAFAQQSLALSASVVGGALVLRSSAYGSLTTFEVRSTALGAAGEQTGLVAATGGWESHAGVDVAGTINGVTATGQGQALLAPATDATLGGLALTITATAAGALGTFTYTPGVAARLDAAASDAIDFGTGSITTAISGRQQKVTDLDKQISGWDVRLAAREANMRRMYAAMETALGTLRNQSSWLAGQLASLPSGSSSR